jgi:tRNA modification GTPase
MSPDELLQTTKEIKEQNSNVIICGNKTDTQNSDVKSLYPGTIFISAKEGNGIESLKEALFNNAVGKEINTENVIVTNARHYAALSEVLKSIKVIEEGLDNHISGDLLAPDIHRCLHYLGEITGEVTNEDRLDYIFSKFCIGK